MRNGFHFATALPAAVGLAALVAGVGCGDDLESEGTAQISVETPGSDSQQAIELGLPCQSERVEDPGTVRLLSNGDQPLEITSIEMSNTPERLLFRGEETGTSCTFDAEAVPWNDGADDCGERRYCDDNQGCLDTRLPSETVTIEPEASREFDWILAAADFDDERAAISCPEPGEEVPQNLREDYCGEVTLETNTGRDQEPFDNGAVTLYFQIDADRKGIVEVVENSLTLNGIQPGQTTGPKRFSVRNNSPDDELTISRLSVQNQTRQVQISPADTPLTVEPSSEQNFDVSIDLPEDFDLENLAEDDFIEIQSSAVNRCSTSISLFYNTSSTSGPAALLDRESLAFGETNPQSVTARNVGRELLLLSRQNFEPDGLAQNYTIRFDGEEIGPDQASWAQIQSGESASFDVEFTGNSGGVGEMFLSHNDDEVGGRHSIVLLGDEGGGFGRAFPSDVNFNFGTQEARTVVVWNRGSEELTLNPQLQGPNMPSNPEDTPLDRSNLQIDGLSDASPIPPGDVATGQLTFDGASGSTRTTFTLEMQSDTVGSPMNLAVSVTEVPDGESLQPGINPVSGETVEVGQIARFDSSPSNGNSNLSGDAWFLMDRPQESTVFREAFGDPDFSIRPDTAGTYTVAFAPVEAAGDGTLQRIATFDLTVEEASN